MKRRAWIVLILSLVAAATAIAQAQGQDQGPGAPDGVPWWGPEDFDEGWTLRVPVVVENPRNHPIENAPVRADLDVGDLAERAGWTTGRVGSETQLKSFTLQPGSARVVSYTNFRLPRTSPSDASLAVASPDLSGEARYTTPARVTTGFLRETPPGPYDATSNPILSVRWIADGTMEPGEARHYMVYLEVEEHGEQPAQDDQRVYDALGARHWISRGDEVYGAGERVTVSGFEDGTEVAVYTYTSSQPTLADVDGENPFEIDAQDSQTLALGGEATPFRVVASNPVVANGQASPGTIRRFVDMGFVPSRDGTLRGTEFDADVYPGEYYVYATTAAGAGGKVNGQEFHTEGAVTPIQVGERLRVSVDNPILIQGELGHRRHQFATLSGAPTGAHLVGSYHGIRTLSSGAIVHDSGVLEMRTLDAPARLVGRTTDDDPRQVIPSSGSSEGLVVSPQDPGFVQGRDSWGFMPIDLQAVDPSTPDGTDGDARVIAFGGKAQQGVSSPLGGEWARRFVGPTDAHVFGFYNRTRVEATDGSGETHVTVLQRGQRLEVSGSATSPFDLEASKPVAVVPTSGAYFGPGRLESLDVQTGSLQYRGHLVSLTPQGDAQEPVVETTTFGEPVTYDLVVENRGRETDGSSLSDAIRLSHTPAPPGWNVTLDTREVELDSGENRTVTVTVRPPETRDAGTRLKVEVRATSQGNPDVEVGVQLVTLLQQRREVGIWYEEVDGPQSLTHRFQPGEERTIPVLVQNSGSGPDTVSLSRTGGQVGWSTTLQDEGEEVDAVSLEAGEVRELDLVVGAPPRGSLALPTSFSLTAASTNDTTATDKLLFEGIVLAKSKIGLDTPDELLHARPGETIVFPLELSNDGNASADVQLNASVSAPDTWGAPIFRHRGKSLAAVDNRLTSVPPTGDDPVALRFEVPVPDNASGRRSVKILTSAQTSQGSGGSSVTLPLNVFVEPIVDLDVESQVETVVPPGRSSNWTLSLHNAGNVNATLTLLPEDVPRGWELDYPPVVELGENATRRISGSVAVPAGASPTNVTLALEVGLPNGTATTASIPIRVPNWRTLDIEPPGTRTLVPGVPTALEARVQNAGNRPSPVDIDAEAPDGWEVGADGRPAVLEPLQRGSLQVTVTPPRDAGNGNSTLRLTPGVERGPSLPGVPPPASVAFDVRTHVPDLAVLNATREAVDEAGASSVRGVVVNRGEAVVENVTVGLLRGETAVADTTLTRVPPGSPRNAVIQVPEDVSGDAGELSLVVDPADLVPETDEDNNRAAVAAGTVQTPAPGALLSALVAGLAALAARRRTSR